MRKTLRALDLFAGAGGLTLGFHDSGHFESVFAVEIDEAAARTYAKNFSGAIVRDTSIAKLSDDDIPDADVVIGGPPCQGFSPLGRDRDDASRAELNGLWRQYKRVLELVRPVAFVVENVPEFLGSAQYSAFLRACRRSSRLKDYVIDDRVVSAADYGVPQRRRRGFVIGSRVADPTRMWPTAVFGPEGDAPYATVRDWIGDLPLEPVGFDISTNRDGTQNLHFGRRPTAKSLERYRTVPEGGNRFDLARERPDLLPPCWQRKATGTTDVFGRLSWNRPALTIRTEFFKPEKGRYLHPQCDRPITHREAARLQTFPDRFQFEGTKLQVARQIGNAVPPLLAKAVAERVFAELARS